MCHTEEKKKGVVLINRAMEPESILYDMEGDPAIPKEKKDDLVFFFEHVHLFGSFLSLMSETLQENEVGPGSGEARRIGS